MKPPWKYFAQLVSRQRASETADKTSAPEDPVVAAAIDREIDAGKPDLPSDLTAAAKAEAPREPEPSKSHSPGQQPKVEDPVQVSRPRQARVKTAKKAHIGSTVEIPVITTDAPAPATSSPADPLFDRATSLDEEIKQLKDLLAQKLRIQNAQLREMLKRFERS